MLSVTTLRNLKKILTQFLYEEKEEVERGLINLREVQKREVNAELQDRLDLSEIGFIREIEVANDGTVYLEIVPTKLSSYEKLTMTNEKIREVNDEFMEKVKRVERWFTLAEAANVLNLPEMPDDIRAMLDRMVESLR